MKTISLPWPPSALSPNARGHWAIKARIAAKVRKDTCVACQAAGVRALPWERMHVAIEFQPASRRAYDLDNAVARCKSLLDGMADATLIDDSRWSLSLSRGPVTKGGAVIITVSEIPPEESASANGENETSRKGCDPSGSDHNPNHHERVRL